MNLDVTGELACSWYNSPRKTGVKIKATGEFELNGSPGSDTKTTLLTKLDNLCLILY